MAHFYMRVGPDNRADFEAEGMEPFLTPQGTTMPYYEVPARILEDPETLTLGTLKARQAALEAKADRSDG